MRTVLFHRDYRRFQGGHLKVWDYFGHVRHSKDFSPSIYFEPGSLWDDSNPWKALQVECLKSWNPKTADILFMGGMDWKSLPPDSCANWPKPVINIIQHVRHANPELPLHGFLSNRAVRICVSQEITDAITATGRVNGPVFTIPNGIDLSLLPVPNPQIARKTDLLMAGLKNPAMAKQLEERFAGRGLRVQSLTDLVLRGDFLQSVASSRITAFLPGATEGFYLPALEGMALGTLVVCPDCVGNRSFCQDGVNCLRPAYRFDALAAAVEDALAFDAPTMERMTAAAAQTARWHDIARERTAFLGILNQIDNLWK